MSDTFGPSSRKPLAYFDREASCWRMSQDTFLSEESPSLETLPVSGMTLGGWLYALPMLERVIAAPDGFALLGTPRVGGGGRASSVAIEAGETRSRLEAQVAMLPTPMARDWKGRTGESWGTPSLANLLPTPRVAADRTSRAAMTTEGHWSAPSLAQAIELAQGILPREFETWDEVPRWHGDRTPSLSSDTDEFSDD